MLQGLAVGQWVGAPTLGEPEPAVGGRTKSGGRWWIEHQSPGRIDALQDEAWGRTRKGGSARRSNERTTPLLVRLGPDNNATAETQWAGSPTEILDNLHTTLLDWVTAVNANTETLAAGDADK
ncbi:hypothetical protein [Mycobacterium avium]|uniref:hypothetical protein n=1 Tax=Mycobacterium avium TaxID=1764 RepID=UPI000B4ACB00|nr:hypothetical protein [Mycobacterium avium]QBC87372.1 hypothetical protein B6K05_023380 [Mycobacterium avium subsp. hominissuis]